MSQTNDAIREAFEAAVANYLGVPPKNILAKDDSGGYIRPAGAHWFHFFEAGAKWQASQNSASIECPICAEYDSANEVTYRCDPCNRTYVTATESKQPVPCGACGGYMHIQHREASQNSTVHDQLVEALEFSKLYAGSMIVAFRDGHLPDDGGTGLINATDAYTKAETALAALKPDATSNEPPHSPDSPPLGMTWCYGCKEFKSAEEVSGKYCADCVAEDENIAGVK